MNNETKNNAALAEARLRKLCEENVRERYGETIPPQVAERLESELALICERENFCNHYLIAHEIAAECRAQNTPIIVGGAGASLVAFVLGITQTNPLKPHFYCPRCGHAEFDYQKHFDNPLEASETDCGFELVGGYRRKILCPKCSEEHVRDGHDLPFESFWEPIRELPPAFDFYVPEELESKLKRRLFKLLDDTVGIKLTFQHACLTAATFIHGDRMLSAIKKLQELTEVSEAAIPIDGIDYLEFFGTKQHEDIPMLRDMSRDIIDFVTITKFSDLVEALGYHRGSNVMSEELLMELYPLKGEKLIAHREDIFQALTKHGVDKNTAYRVMTQVADGKAESVSDEDIGEMKAHGITDEYIGYMRGIGALARKSDSIEFAIKIFELMWYKQNFRRDYYSALK